MIFNDGILPVLLLVQYFVESMHAFMCMFMHIENKCVYVEARLPPFLRYSYKLNLELANSVCWSARILQGASYLHFHSTGITPVQYPAHLFDVGTGDQIKVLMISWWFTN